MGVLLIGLLTLVAPTESYQKKVVFLIDVSGSIGDDDIEEALLGFCEAQNPTDDYVIEVKAFDDKVYSYPGGEIQCPGPLDINGICGWVRANRGNWRGLTNLNQPLAQLSGKISVVVISDGWFGGPITVLRSLIKSKKFQVGFIGVGKRMMVKNLETLAKAGRGGLRVLKMPEPVEPIQPLVPPWQGPIK